MSAPEDLKEIYLDELKDLWSANDQMLPVVKDMAAKAGDAKLKALLDKSLTGITKHTEATKALLASHDESVAKEHCKGMQGLVAEARKHALDEKFDDDDVRDVVIVAQYQRMTHYGIAGFGTAAAYAEALGLTKDAKTLNTITREVYGGDEYATLLAEKTVNLAAA